jgi:hypothetical protein
VTQIAQEFLKSSINNPEHVPQINKKQLYIINDNQQDATNFDLFVSSLLCMFRAMPSPIIRSTELYLQLQVLSTDIAAGWYMLLMMGEGITRNM